MKFNLKNRYHFYIFDKNYTLENVVLSGYPFNAFFIINGKFYQFDKNKPPVMETNVAGKYYLKEIIVNDDPATPLGNVSYLPTNMIITCILL